MGVPALALAHTCPVLLCQHISHQRSRGLVPAAPVLNPHMCTPWTRWALLRFTHPVPPNSVNPAPAPSWHRWCWFMAAEPQDEARARSRVRAPALGL